MLNRIQYTGELAPVELGRRPSEGVVDLWLRRNSAAEQGPDGGIQTADEAYMNLPAREAPERADVEARFGEWFERASAWREATEKPDPLRELTAKIDALLTDQGLTLREIGGGAYEVVRRRPASGDDLDPIPYAAGDAVTAGLWYFAADKSLPREAIRTGVPGGFQDRAYFDFVD